MNNGAFGENFPYSNFHDLNMDWIIKIAKDFLDQYTHIQEVIAEGEESLGNLTQSGLEQLQEKADTLENLLQEWYNEHSTDIANQLADALEDIAEALTDALGDIDSELTTKIAEFNSLADQKTAESIASIPADYTTLANKVSASELEINLLNAFNILDDYTKTNRTANGIIYSWNGSRCTVTGTAEGGNSFANIYVSTNALPTGISAGDVVYAGNIGQDGSEVEIYSVDSSENTTFIYGSQHTYNFDYITIPSSAVGLVFRLFVAEGTTVNETVYPYLSKTPPQSLLEQRTFKNWLYGDCVFIRSIGTTDNRAGDINTALNNHHHVVLLTGDFYISDSIIIPAGSTLEGIGPRTKIVANGTNVVSVTMRNNSRIANLWLDGGLDAQPESEGNRYGIYASSVTSPFWIENVIVSGFNKYGIYIGGKGGDTIPQYITNSFIYYCYTGLHITESEYIDITNVCVRRCFRGVYENGGNNKYTGCSFDTNNVGAQFTTLYANNTHGQFVGCSFNHNSEYAIFAGDATNGEIFSGCQFHFGTINLASTTAGFNFIGCQFGTDTVFNITGSKKNYVSHSEFWVNPTINTTGSGSLKLHECYNIQTGNEITNP